MSKHTPTPWAGSDYAGDIVDGDGELLATAYPMDGGGHDTAKANAAFIVKAVNSHEALKNALTLLMQKVRESGTMLAFSDELKHAEAALAVAKGRVA